MDIKEYYSTVEIARLLGVSRITVFKKIKKGEITARKIGRNFIIPISAIPPHARPKLSAAQKTQLNEVIKKIIKQYRETFRLLAKS